MRSYLEGEKFSIHLLGAYNVPGTTLPISSSILHLKRKMRLKEKKTEGKVRKFYNQMLLLPGKLPDNLS